MFNENDKTTLIGYNAKDKNGELLNYIIKFPIQNEDFDIPEEINQISIIEGYTDTISEGFKTAFQIFIGKKAKLKDLLLSDSKVDSTNSVFENIRNTEELVCYYKSGDITHAYALVKTGDIVVEDINQFRTVLLSISDNYKSIKKSINNIKKLAR